MFDLSPMLLRALLSSLALVLVACSEDRRPSGTVCTKCGDCEEARPVTSAYHVLGPIEYPDPPPTGGDHNPCWATWGVHDDVVPVENWVHNLEHGGVVFLYTTSDGGALDAKDDAALKELVGMLPRTLLTEYPALPKRFGVVAWGHRLVSDCLDVDADQQFYAKHFNLAPESIPDDPKCN
jgi:hypothetical protein